MDKRKLFSLIIPCHNPDKTIRRLYTSLLNQFISLCELEVIVVDDNSESLDYRNIIREFSDIDTIFTQTQTNVHCPGNTRQRGLDLATGEWVFFCDQDDFFEDGSLLKVKDYIKSRSTPIYVISTIMRGYSEESGKCYKEFAHKQTWLHGKWYSTDNLIKPYNIRFKKDLVTHEDAYFNSLVLSKLVLLGKDWDYLNIYTYRWVDNPQSVTRKPTKDRGYLFENFQDYLVAASDPFKEALKVSEDIFFVNQIMMTILHAYFYYEAAVFYCGSEGYKDVRGMIAEYLKSVILQLGFSINQILDFIYFNPDKYYLVMRDCADYTGKFIVRTSFKDFIHGLLGI